MHTRLLPATVACLLFALPLGAQAPLPNGYDHGKRWYVTAGPAGFISEVFEGGGVTLGPSATIGVSLMGIEGEALAAYWKDLSDFNVYSLQARVGIPLAPARAVVPDLVLGVGYTRSHFTGEPGPFNVIETNGASATYGLRFRVLPWNRWGATLGASIRTDDGGWSADWRAAVAHSVVSAPGTGDFGIQVNARAYHMIPVGGPWVFVEPGYGMRARVAVADEWSASATIAVFHWQIPGDAFLRNYLWDTRAIVGIPAVSWSPNAISGLSTSLGPAVISMGEGPDIGVSVGWNLEAAYRFTGLPVALDVGTGWLWIPRGREEDSDYAGDQHGFMIFGGVGLW